MSQSANPSSNFGTISVALIWPFLSLAQRATSVDLTVRVRELLGLSAAQLADPGTPIPFSQVAKLLDRVIALSGERDIGLLAARCVEPIHLGLIADVTRTKATLGTAIQAGIRYVPLLGDCVQYRLEVVDDRVIYEVRFDPRIEIHEAAVEFAMAVGLKWARWITEEPDLAPLEAHFTHAEPRNTSRHEKVFRCPLLFDAPVNRCVGSVQSLERRLRGAEPVLAELLERRAENLLQTVGSARDTSSQVRKLLHSQRELRGVSVGQIAKRIGVGSRTLGRRLQNERTSYRRLLDDVRRQLALEALARSEQSAADLAHSLGFASPQGFYRAFRRWTGTTLTTYRGA